jgi:hypothetical protein
VLLTAAGRLSQVQLQNRLMRASDREIALAMMYMEDRDRNRIISHLGKRKGSRVQEELDYQSRLAVTYEQYRVAVSRILDLLRNEGNTESVRSYIRPRGTGRSRF